jgi:hypothetical protein
LEFLAAAISHLREALENYESGVLKKLIKE